MEPHFRAHDVTSETRADGTIILQSGLSLGEVVNDTNVWLRRWAETEPDRVFLSERDGGGWRQITYADMWTATQAVAQGLLQRGIGYGDAVVVLSGPSIDHAILMQACQMIGAVIVPLAEQYSLIPAAAPRLDFCAAKVDVALVYAACATKFADALSRDVFTGVPKICSDAGTSDAISFASLQEAEPGPELDAAYAQITHDTVAKLLFTSGSTSDPKAVPNTQRMLCVNQAQYLACLPLFGAKHHTIIDWLPWNHTFAANSNFNMVLSNGMTLYLDDGKPLPALFPRTLENARQVPITLTFDVPIAHAQKVAAMREDEALRQTYFRNLELFFYAAASLPKDVWTAVEDMAMAERGEVPLMISSWGMTETAPAAIVMHEPGGTSGNIGVPMPEVTLKLIPMGAGRYELRCTGPNVFTGYLDDAERTDAAFDDEGFFITGDAVGFVDPQDFARGLFFDGRVSEDFKLTTGIWVQASTLRLELLPRLKGLAQDIVICGEGRDEIGLLIFAAPSRAGSAEGVVTDAGYLSEVQNELTQLAGSATGSSNRIARALIMAEPPDVGSGEITAKGSLNIRAILDRRAELVGRLYDESDPAVVRPA
ncbi:MAG: AMP-binding protein [Paracoccaceae bacterium]